MTEANIARYLSTTGQMWRTSENSSSATLYTGRGVLKGVIINTDGTNNGTVICYDGPDATPVIFRCTCVGADFTYGAVHLAIEFTTSLRMEISGTGASAVFYWQSL